MSRDLTREVHLYKQSSDISVKEIREEIGSKVAEWLAHSLLVLEVQGSIPCCWLGKFVGPNTLPFGSFAGMT